MIRSELDLRLLNRCRELTPEGARIVLDVFFDKIYGVLVCRDRVEVCGFGCFSAILHDAWTGGNPRRGVPVNGFEKRFVRFKASKQLLK